MPEQGPPQDRDVPSDNIGKLEPNYFCRAWNAKRLKYCRARAGSGTDHVGAGRCDKHGGTAQVKHGLSRRYQFVTAPRIGELVTRLQADENVLDTTPEIALLRALTHDYIERFEPYTEALLAWHRSWGPKSYPIPPAQADALRRVIDAYAAQLTEGITDPGELSGGPAEDIALARDAVEFLWAAPAEKPHTVPDIADAARLVSEVSKAVERVERLKAANHVPLERFQRFMMAIDHVLRVRIADSVTLEKVRTDILSIRA